MNNIDSLVRRIKATVPSVLLKTAFSNDAGAYYNKFSADSIESLVEQFVIRDEFIPDINLERGTQSVISVTEGKITYQDKDTIAYYFDRDDVLNGLDVISAHSLYNQRHYMPSKFTGEVENKGGPRLTNPKVRVYGVNTIVVEGKDILDIPSAFEVLLSNDANLNNIAPMYVPALQDAVTLLAKGLIYNRLIIDAQEASLLGGVSLGKVNDVLESYDNSYTEYRELMDANMAAWLLMNDSTAHHDYISGMLFPTL